jgi:hypothetical protein
MSLEGPMPIRVRMTLGVLALLGAFVLSGWWWGPRQWDAETSAMRDRLLGHARGDPGVYTQAELRDLPAPVVRYFKHVLPERRRHIARARIAWEGSFNMGAPGADKWVPFTAVQDFVTGAPGMLWDARITSAPGLKVRVRDALVGGSASMRGAVMGLVTVVDKAGTPEMTRASLQRYLAEATWFPTALLPGHGVQWTAIDDSRALATVCAGGVSASFEFRFDAEGRPTSIYVPARLYDDGRSPPSVHPWLGRNLSFATHEGVLVPGHAIVEWMLPGGSYAYWEGHPVTISYE